MTGASTNTDPVLDVGGEWVDERVAGLGDMPAGPRLAAVLAELDVAKLSDWELVEVLRACYRQASHQRSQVVGPLAELIRRRQDPVLCRDEDPEWQWAAGEVAAALVITRGWADALCGLAWDLSTRLPDVGAALSAGLIDEPKARVFSEWTMLLSEEHARAVVAALLPRAGRLTTAGLRREIAKLALALDPAWARRRYKQAVTTRRVVGYRNHDGTANLTGENLPVDDVAACCDRLDRLARAAKAAGHSGRMDQLRADLFIGLINGGYEGLTDQQILDNLTAGKPVTTGTDDNPRPDEDGHRSGDTGSAQRAPGQDGQPDHSNPPPEPDDQDAGRDTAGRDTAGRDTAGRDTAGRDTAGRDTAGEDNEGGDTEPPPADKAGNDVGDDDSPLPEAPSTAADAGDEAGDGGPPPPEPAAGAGGGSRRRVVGRSGGLRLLARLATIAGADERPGMLLGWGPVHADLARTIATTPAARWWYVLVNPDGTPAAIGPIHTRPDPTRTDSNHETETDGAQPPRGNCRLHVWLHITQQTLDELAAHPPPGWEQVIGEITTSLATNPAGPPDGDPTARLPGTALRRWLHVRDHTCTFPTCAVPAHRSEPDHTHEHSRGGPTTHTNLASACKPHHRLRDGGWTVRQPQPGYVEWTSPSGHTYTRAPSPSLDDLPDAIPHLPSDDDSGGDYLPPEQDWRTDSCMAPEPPKKPRPPEAPPPPTPPKPEDDIPPF